jgi:hypothetical protein
MDPLKIAPEQAISLLNERIDAIDAARMDPHGMGYYDVVRWCSKTWQVADAIYESGDPRPEELRLIGLPSCSCISSPDVALLLETSRALLEKYVREIQDMAKNPV